MKRGYTESPSTSLGPPHSRFRHNPEGDSQFLEDESTKNFARKVADHYSARTNQTLEEREASPIIHLKKLNNWIKSVLIQLYARRGDAVLDLACGKGGDLIKWDKAKIGYYVGIDIAEGSIEDCRTRYNGDADHHQRRKKFTFPARLICGDCFEVRLDRVLEDDAPFDICSCQFAMHYSWSTEARARRALANVSALLRPGGIFIGTMPDANVIIKKLREAEGLAIGNSVYWIRFDEDFSKKKFKTSSPFGIKYKFHLEDAVDCPEWIVPFHVFKSLAEEYDLDLVLVKNSHEFVDEYLKKPEFVELMRRLGALGDGNQDQTTLSQDEWEEVLHTCPSHICQGVAEFEETLMHRCSVYGHRSGTHNSAKYEARHFLLYASVVGKPGLDMGKHWVDLTKLLPVTLDELEEDKSSGKWSTSYKLSGMAKGATLNVSYGFLIIKDNSIESNNVIFPELLNLNQNRTSTGNDMLQQVGSIPSHGSHCPSLSLDVKILNEGFPNPGLELSRSISFIYKKLDEGKLGNSLGSDIFSEDVESFKPKPNLFFESAEEIIGSDCDDAEFDVTEKGIEFSTKELLKLEDGAAQPYDGSKVETVHVDEIIKDEETDCDLKNDFYGKCKDGDVMDDDNFKENSAYTKDSSMEELEYFLDSLSISDSAELHSPLAMSDFLEQENYLEVKSKFKASKAVKKSLSLDDATESVASEFLKMLGIEDSSFGLSADSDLESPRECLLRQFEKDNLASGNFIFDSEETEVQTQFGCDAPTGSDSGNFGTPTGSEFGNCCKDLHFISVIQAAEEEHKTMGQPLVSRRKAKMLEDLETVALMQEWGLSEKVFQNSPRYSSGGFGSPIYLPPEEPVRLPPLGEGLGPFIQTKDGGFLRSMHPSVFRNVKNGGSLIMQASVPVVLPAQMGADIMEILQHLASIGIEKFSMQASKLMPLEDITGKTMHQIACEAAFALEVPERHTSFVHESEVGQDTFGLGNTAEEFSSWQNNDNLNSSSVGGEMVSDYVSLEDLAPSAMDKIEVLSIEGLRIHSGMSDEEAPSCISSKYVEEISDFDGKKTVNLIRTLDFEGAVGLHLLNASDIGSDDNGLMSLSITLDEWLRLDSGIICDEDQISEHTSKILAAHHAKCMDLVNGRLKRDRKWGKASGRKWGMLQNNFTFALMVQLRDPFRNYEPVGAPVLALIQVERVFFPPKPKIYNMESEPSNSGEVVDQHESVVKGEVDGEIKEKEEDEELISQFKITQVHVAGVNTEPGRKKLWCSASQHQSGFRWLLAKGIDKTNKHVLSKSKVIVKASSQVRAQVWPGEILWSISCRFNGTRAKWKELAALNLHIRNPDVIFPSETVRL